MHPIASSTHAAVSAALCAALLPCLARAQSTAPTQQVVVTGNPLRSTEVAAAVSVLGGDALLLRRGSTLGETLDGLPGVSSSYFGPNANRPVIRGQDGDRIRMLTNAGASLDASSLSFDHAVPIDPLVVERVEVLRGAAALLYGGSAVGGVVNAIDNRVPRTTLAAPGGVVEMRLGGAARERGAGAVLEAGGSGWAMHADAFKRHTDDTRVPAFDRPEGDASVRRETIVNSASRAEGGAFGASMVWRQGYLGAAADTYRNTYGIVAEDDVFIRMRRDKLTLAGEARELGGGVRTVRGQVQGTDYRHEEVEGSGEVGTTFTNKGYDGRVELEHAPWRVGGGEWRGVLGAQAEDARFSALGAEAFVPSTQTRQAAAFVFEELRWGQHTFTLGARVERTRVDSNGDAADAEEEKFGPATSRRFTTRSLALGALVSLSPQWRLSGNLALGERAPTYAELYANGVHIATAAYERGNPDLARERGTHFDAALQWGAGATRVKAGVFHSRFDNYISLGATGEPDFITDEGEVVPVYAFAGVPARFSGVEVEGQWRALDGPQRVDLDLKLDLTRAANRSTGEALPRIAPLRTTLGLSWGAGPWALRGEVVHAATQTRVSADDVPTYSYTLLNASVNYALKLGSLDALVFVKLTNLGDTLAYSAASAATVRALAPLPGRAAMVGVRLAL